MKTINKKKLMVAFGAHLRFIRESKKMTQSELASEVGMELTSISRMERGGSNATLETIFKLAVALGVPPKKLLDFRYPDKNSPSEDGL
jgi:transcriptional regulator with XRE-family HTH domain